ncbi:MAG TPA: PP2C family serine/threonine-protein phosphatase [Candidatus Acidoferrales bacterium]|jgi:hypothetical protein|nr:PP2C family serine/threonine-protein phosphatase [Candidatus Acidoferrales bacterium]
MTGGGWKYAAASVIGTSHQGSSEGVCQDSHACQYLQQSSAFVAVVSDGAGSASHSQLGSRRTCDYIMERATDASAETILSRDFAVDVLDGLRQGLQELADASEQQLRDFACTMLVAVICGNRAAFWQIGDGAMCFRIRDSETFQYAFWPDKGEYANETSFVTQANAQQHLEFDLSDCEIVQLAVFSDGLERLALDFTKGEPHNGFFNGLFPYLSPFEAGHAVNISSQIAGFLGSERVTRRTDDDKTLILAALEL